MEGRGKRRRDNGAEVCGARKCEHKVITIEVCRRGKR
jgi:hypothetical protein